MKKAISFLALAVFFGALTVNSAVAQAFEGVIYFDKVKSETTKYVYYVKGDRVRVDEFGADGSVKGIMLCDIKKGTVMALSPDRKLFMDASNPKTNPPSGVQVDKTQNKKKILGYDCEEWIVKSESEGTVISYWVLTGTKYNFFEPLLKALNRKDRLSKYFLECPGITGRFTLMGVEKALDGSVRTSLNVTKMEEKTVDVKVFDIPADYTKFEK